MPTNKTSKKQETNWKCLGQNYVLNGKGFYLSYKPTPMWGSGEETALSSKEGWRILNGDFREQYTKLAPKGLKACVKFFNDTVKKNPDLRCGWSSFGL